jgi:hypothetical protein
MESAVQMARTWRLIQAVAGLLGVAVVALLFVQPAVGLVVLWDVVIPIAPALVAIAPGVWRNVCPVGSISQLPRHFGISAQRKPSPVTQGRFALAGVLLLLSIIPLRHILFDLDGPATGALLIAAALLAAGLSAVFDGKSGWCAGICPVHQVEKLYGQGPAVTTLNAHCSACSKCVVACPDSTNARRLAPSLSTPARRAASFLLIGSFPGYVWGWFQVPDHSALPAGLGGLGAIYFFPLAGGLVTLALYALLVAAKSKHDRHVLDRAFAAAAISCYYWLRLPSLFGLSATLSPPLMLAVQCGVTAFWWWWLVQRRPRRRSWMIRPPTDSLEKGRAVA